MTPLLDLGSLCVKCLHLGYLCDLDAVQTRCPGHVCTDCDHATREANQVEGVCPRRACRGFPDHSWRRHWPVGTAACVALIAASVALPLLLILDQATR